MKKYPKIVQCDSRGQIVIPKDIRQELGIDEGTGFWMFSISDEGILLKKIKDENLSDSSAVRKIADKSHKLGVKKSNLDKTVKKYKRKRGGRLEEI